MIIIASSNGNVGIAQAMQVLKQGGSALDAVEAGILPVEDNPMDHSVGYGGFPSILGEVELDASIMDGKTLMAGAVGCVQGFRHPISIARRVMEIMPHVFLVGPGAERFAEELGFKREELLSAWAKRAYRKKLLEFLPEDALAEIAQRTDLYQLVKDMSDPRRTVGTVNFIAKDAYGNIATGVSTSGWYGKYPGRLGDSPVIGAGNYADNRYGAAACTGMGEMAIRAGTARSVLLYMKLGMTVEEAGVQAMQDLNDLGGPYMSEMNIIAMDKDGRPAGFTSASYNKEYIYLTEDMDEPAVMPRTHVDIPERWGA